MNGFRKLSVVFSLSLCGAEVFSGNVWYPNDTWSNSRNTAIATPSMWSSEDGSKVCTEISPDDDYVVLSEGIRFSGQKFGGNSLTLRGSTMVFDGGSGNEFPRGGLILEEGTFYNNNSSQNDEPGIGLTAVFHRIAGKVTVLSDASVPFLFKTSQYNDKGTVFSGPVIGDSSAAVRILNWYGIGSNYRMNIRYAFLDTEGYHGRVDVETYANSTFDGLNTASGFYLGTTALPGIVAVGKGATFGAYLGTNACSVGTLSMARGSRICVPYDETARSAGRITVTGSFAVTGEADAGPIDVLLLVTKLDDGGKYPVLSVPAGTDLKDEDFSLTAAYEAFPGEVKLCVEPDENGGKTLFAVCCVRLSKSDNTSYKSWSDVWSSAFTNAPSWTDGRVPHAGPDYFVDSGFTFREVDDKNMDYVFPAGNLTILGGDDSVTLICGSRSLEVTNLVVRSGANLILKSKHSNPPVVKGGTLELEEGAGLRFYGYVGAVSTIGSEVTGGGDMETVGETATGESSANGGLDLTGLNTNWTGRLRIDYAESSSRGYPGYDKGYYRLYVEDERNLGGTLETFDFKALTLAGYGRFCPKRSLTLSPGYNRGIFIADEGGRFDVGDGEDGADIVLTCNRTVTVGGPVYKEGTGTLVLGGGLKFYDAADDAAVDEIPDGTVPRLMLMNGTLGIGAAKAYDGLQIVVTNIAGRVRKIRVPADAPQGSDLARYGFYNVKAGAVPFVLAEGVDTLPIDFDGQTVFPENEATVRTNALLTVADSAVESVRAMLPARISRPYSSLVHMSWVEIPVEGVEATTFAFVSAHRGTVIVLR